MVRTFENVSAFAAVNGEVLGTSSWLTVDQARVNEFADATSDHQWIHVDVERARSGPFGSTIAHGYLTLSLVPRLGEDIYSVEGLTMGLNYGLDLVRFPAPLPVGSRIRATATLASATEMSMGTRFTIHFVVEAENVEKPVLVADVIYLLAD